MVVVRPCIPVVRARPLLHVHLRGEQPVVPGQGRRGRVRGRTARVRGRRGRVRGRARVRAARRARLESRSPRPG